MKKIKRCLTKPVQYVDHEYTILNKIKELLQYNFTLFANNASTCTSICKYPYKPSGSKINFPQIRINQQYKTKVYYVYLRIRFKIQQFLKTCRYVKTKTKYYNRHTKKLLYKEIKNNIGIN